MKPKKKFKPVIIAAVTLLIVIALGEAGMFFALMKNKTQISSWLEEYDTGTATFEDVAAVNLFFKDYVKVGETEKNDRVISRSLWFFSFTVMGKYKKVDRLGSAYVFSDKDNNVYTVVATDEWCPF
ncbi:MAG: hypothetical protein II931_01770, partial [Clostridia bacterium]|nr:hypothetical protein [Clostridia bacterium]